MRPSFIRTRTPVKSKLQKLFTLTRPACLGSILYTKRRKREAKERVEFYFVLVFPPPSLLSISSFSFLSLLSSLSLPSFLSLFSFVCFDLLIHLILLEDLTIQPGYTKVGMVFGNQIWGGAKPEQVSFLVFFLFWRGEERREREGREEGEEGRNKEERKEERYFISCLFLFDVIPHEPVETIKKMYLDAAELHAKFWKDENLLSQTWLRVCGRRREEGGGTRDEGG